MALQSHVEEATLATLDGVNDIEVIDVYLESDEGEPREYGVTLEVTGSGSVDWAVNALSSWDLEKFSGLVEGDTAGGGIILDSDPSKVQITLSGRYLPSEEEWSEIEVESARQTPQEVQEREAQNHAAQLHTEQELGLFPSDEDIEAMEAPQMPRENEGPRFSTRGARSVSGALTGLGRCSPRTASTSSLVSPKAYEQALVGYLTDNGMPGRDAAQIAQRIRTESGIELRL